MFFVALLPIVVILILMVGLQWKASRAGGAGYLTALTLAVTQFGSGSELLAYAHAKAVFLILDVLFIIWTAYLLFKVVETAGGIDILSRAMPHLTSDRGMQALIIGWAFASFLQGVGGFGVPVAVIAPMFVGLGFSPVSAVVIPSLGHSWAVTFGSLGSSFNAMMAATGLEAGELAPAAAVLLGAAGIAVGWVILFRVGGWKALQRLWVPALIMGTGMAVSQYLTVTKGLWNIGGLIGGSSGLLIGLLLSRKYRGDLPAAGSIPARKVLTAVHAYLILVALTLVIQLFPPVREFLGRWTLGLDFPALSTNQGFTTPAGPGRQIPVFRHAGMILLVTSFLGGWIFQYSGWYPPGSWKSISRETVQRMLPSSLGITSMVMMAVIMQHAGMIDILAGGFSTAVGRGYPILSPWLGALGAFMTGSNTNSNLVMSQLQLRTAEILNLPAALILAAQTTGGAIGSVIAPTKIIVGASTAGMDGKEGQVLRKLLPPAAGLIALVSLLVILGAVLL